MICGRRLRALITRQEAPGQRRTPSSTV